MRALIAGGAGFIGSHLIDRLVLRPELDEIVVVDNLWTGRRQNLAHLRDPRISLVVSDIETASLEGSFDEVYHLASPASPPWYMAEPLRTISANVVGGLRLISLLREGGLFACTSTSEVYGDPMVTPQPESYRGSVDCTGPRSSYDESKRCLESMLFEAARVHGLRVRVARLFNVFGPRTRPDDGRAVSNFITQALSGRPITVHGDGMQTRSWGFIDDIADALARYFWGDGIDFAGPLNIGNDREVPVIDVARYVQALFPLSSIEFLPPTPQDPSNRRPDLTLARRVLPGWQCEVPYEEGIRRTIRWFQGELSAPGFALAGRRSECPNLVLAAR
jgi:nucleoside-diphosphate-sugar epimerase